MSFWEVSEQGAASRQREQQNMTTEAASHSYFRDTIEGGFEWALGEKVWNHRWKTNQEIIKRLTCLTKEFEHYLLYKKTELARICDILAFSRIKKRIKTYLYG